MPLVGTTFCTKKSVNATSQLSFIMTYAKSSSNTESNQSVVTIRAYLYYTGGVSSVNSDYSTFSVGGTNVKTGNYSAYRNTYLLLGSKDITVSHNTDGSFPRTGVNYSVNSYHWQTTSSGTAYIPAGSIAAIPRASSITSASDVTLPGACSITWTPASSTFYYNLSFKIGTTTIKTATGLNPNSTSEYTYSEYTMPITLARYITMSNAGTVTVSLSTYSDSTRTTKIGSTQTKTFKITVPKNSTTKPVVSNFTVTPVNDNATVAEWGVYVAGYSKAMIQATGTAYKGATISSFAISGGTYSNNISDITNTSHGSGSSQYYTGSLNYTGGIIKSSGTKTFKVSTTDSRGISSDDSAQEISVVSYSKPSFKSFSVTRNQSDATRAKVTATWGYSSVNSHNQIKATVYRKPKSSGSYTAISTIPFGSTTSCNIDDTGLSDSTSYIYKITIEDSLGNAITATTTISTISVLLDFRAGGRGLGIGKMAETNSLEVALPTKFSNSVNINDLRVFGIADTALTSSNDLNNYTTPGIYFRVSSVSDSEVGSGSGSNHYPTANTGILEVYKRSGGDTVVQKYSKRLNPSEIWTRVYAVDNNVGTWSEWKSLFGTVMSQSSICAETDTSGGTTYFRSDNISLGSQNDWKIVPTKVSSGLKLTELSTSITINGKTYSHSVDNSDSSVHNSNVFAYTNAGGIICNLDGVVQVGGRLRVSGTAGDWISGAIYKLNSADSSVSSNGYNIGAVCDDYVSSGGRANISIPQMNVKVNFGDKLYLMVRNATASSRGNVIGSDCVLTVTYISY